MSGLKFTLICVFAVNSLVSAQVDYLYSQQGSDWPGTCASGTSQSPIDIDTSSSSVQSASQGTQGYLELSTSYSPITVEGVFTTLTYILDSSNSDYGMLTLSSEAGSDKVYIAQQFHFHAPSEHTFDGDHADLEMHIVHLTENSEIAVIALFFDASNKSGAANEFIQKVIESENQAQSIDLSDLLDGGILNEFYTYSGSLTNHPCNEGVTWIVTKKIWTISEEQLDFFVNEWAGDEDFSNGNGNNRIVQELNGRVVYDVSRGDDDSSGVLMMAAGVLISLLI